MTQHHRPERAETDPFAWPRPLFDRIVANNSELTLERRQQVADLFNSWVGEETQWRLEVPPPEAVDVLPEISYNNR
jgi:hypothetical protein